jgi:DNA-binding CsgD family transcriptional regulator
MMGRLCPALSWVWSLHSLRHAHALRANSSEALGFRKTLIAEWWWPVQQDPTDPEEPHPSILEETPYGLTAREIDVLQLIADGRTNKEIAEALGISGATVKSYISSACIKLRSRNRTGAVAKALLAGKIR